MVFGAVEDEEILRGGVRGAAFAFHPEPEGGFHGGFRFRGETAWEMGAVLAEKAEDADVIWEGEVGPGG